MPYTLNTPEHLTALDGTFIELEDADQAAHMHIGGIMVFGPRGSDAPPSVGELRAYLDIHAHVLRAKLPAPGGWEHMLEWAGEYFSIRLDRRRPLWEVAVVHSLADGHRALVTKTHHCMVDGVGAVDASYLLFDGVADALRAAPPEDHFGPSPRWHSTLTGAVGAGVHTITHPLDVARRVGQSHQLAVRRTAGCRRPRARHRRHAARAATARARLHTTSKEAS
jgi:hypothetical protein